MSLRVSLSSQSSCPPVVQPNCSVKTRLPTGQSISSAFQSQSRLTRGERGPAGAQRRHAANGVVAFQVGEGEPGNLKESSIPSCQLHSHAALSATQIQLCCPGTWLTSAHIIFSESHACGKGTPHFSSFCNAARGVAKTCEKAFPEPQTAKAAPWFPASLLCFLPSPFLALCSLFLSLPDSCSLITSLSLTPRNRLECF